MPTNGLNVCKHALLSLFVFVLMWNMQVSIRCADLRARTYIVHMDKSAMPKAYTNHEQWYKFLLSSVKGNGLLGGNTMDDDDLYIYIYDSVMHGFSAKLTEAQVNTLEKMPGYVLSFPDPSGELDTTYSYKFLGLSSDSGVWPKAKFGQDTIVGVLDTGLWPESKSFDDHGITEEIPARWKGECVDGTAFDSSLCNRKLIGARYFNKGFLAKYGKIRTGDYNSARDFAGHGSHTSSTAAGNFVPDVDYFGYASGIARGIAPAARLAIYKVGWLDSVVGSDVLAAMQSAIKDGADVLSLSLGFISSPYFTDVIALGAFAAMERGIVVTCSAGNNGPFPHSLHNAAPWILTVGASTLDRDFMAALKLGDGSVFNGTSFYGGGANGNRTLSPLALVYPGSVTGDPACSRKFDPEIVAGKAVLCISDDDLLGQYAKKAGAAALISVGETNPALIRPSFFFTPKAIVTPIDGSAIANYSSSTTKPVVEIEFERTLLGSSTPAPAIAQYSSRGPNQWSPDILKPDLVAPGINILAAWQSNLTLFGSLDPRRVNYNIMSGTSMSCPHVAGLAALIKAVHIDWSPAAIRSALMTTSYTSDNSGQTLRDLGNYGAAATPLDFGAGHVDPEKAIDPGLVYDLGVQDYVNFLCSNTNYTLQQILMITKAPISCSGSARSGVDNLNYPSFTARFNSSPSFSQRKAFERALTNVGDGRSTYKAVVAAPRGVTVRVNPAVLVFQEKRQKLNFTLKVEIDQRGENAGNDSIRYGYLSWVDGKNHVVKSPLVVILE